MDKTQVVNLWSLLRYIQFPVRISGCYYTMWHNGVDQTSMKK